MPAPALASCPSGLGRRKQNMRKLVVFNQVTLDGYFADPNGGMGWAHKDAGDTEWSAFIEENAQGGGQLVFGRITYEHMASFWPTAYAIENLPVVAERMNALPKIVFSRTLDEAAWENTRLVKGDMAAEIRELKKQRGAHMAILGSGSIVSQLASEGLVDEYQIVVNPIVLGKGRTLFDDIKATLPLKLASARTFANGNVLLCYEPRG
jgi:dihydrofolate reductase